MNNTDSAKVLPEWCATRIDETSCWTVLPEHRPYIRCIFSVYCFDATERTHLCEATPSFYLVWLYHGADLDPNTPEDIADQIYNYIAEVGSDNTYQHCHNVNMNEVKRYGPLGEDDVAEYWQGNCPF